MRRSELPAVDLELGLAATLAGADAAALLGEGLALAPEAGQAVADLGQLDLGLALEAVGVLPEDVEDHRGAVDGRSAEQLLEVALLGRAELVVEHDGVGVDGLAQLLQLGDLAAAEVGGGVGGLTALLDPGHGVGAGGVDQEGQLVEVTGGVLLVVALGRDAHEDDLLPEGAVDEPRALATEVTEGASVALDRRGVPLVEVVESSSGSKTYSS